jgi:hypothetical protein
VLSHRQWQDLLDFHSLEPFGPFYDWVIGAKIEQTLYGMLKGSRQPGKYVYDFLPEFMRPVPKQQDSQTQMEGILRWVSAFAKKGGKVIHRKRKRKEIDAG